MAEYDRSRGRYRRFSEYLQMRFGGPVRKLGLDAGFSCPNRDGRLSRDGCVFCDPRGFTARALSAPGTLEQQLTAQIQAGQARGITRFMAYFQPYTNTYAPVETLRVAYDTIRLFPQIKALAIGTRPDCVDLPRLELIAEYAQDYEVWLELGLQSVHEETLKRLNRGHTAWDFFEALALARRFPALRICAHVILGLPGETPEMELSTATALGELKVDGVKFHPLYVVKGTRLEAHYAAQQTGVLSQVAYVQRVGEFLERLWPETIIQRLTADCPLELLVAPDWLADKSGTIRAIEIWLENQGTHQGRRYSA